MRYFSLKLLIKKIFILYVLIIFHSYPVFSNSVLEIKDNDFILGDINAPITIIEYASLSCSHCASFHIDTLPELIKDYVNTGKVKFVFRDFPFNYPALLGSMVLRCVPNNIRFDYTKALYQLQSKWVVRENEKATKELYKIMQSGGMTKEDFNNCISNVELENQILQELMNVQSEFNIKSTPSFLINGRLVEGNKPLSDFRKIINNLLTE